MCAERKDIAIQSPRRDAASQWIAQPRRLHRQTVVARQPLEAAEAPARKGFTTTRENLRYEQASHFTACRSDGSGRWRERRRYIAGIEALRCIAQTHGLELSGNETSLQLRKMILNHVTRLPGARQTEHRFKL